MHTQLSPLFSHSCGSIIFLAHSIWDEENPLLNFIYLWHYLCGFLNLIVKGRASNQR